MPIAIGVGISPVLQALAAAGIVLDFLLLDCFLTDESAPLASPRTAEPGPGTWNITDTNNYLAIVSGLLQLSNVTATGDPRAISVGSVSRLAGVGLHVAIVYNSRGNFGFSSSPATLVSSNTLNAISGTGLQASPGPINVGEKVNDLSYDQCIVLRNQGAFYLIKNGIYTDWTLLWVNSTADDQTLYAALAARSGGTLTTSWDNVSQAQLPAFAVSAGDLCSVGEGGGTSRVDSVSAGNTLVHTADFKLKFTMTALPTSSTNISFRKVVPSGNSGWRVWFNAANRVNFEEWTGAAWTLREQVNGIIFAGTIVEVVCIGDVYTGYADGVQIFQYTSGGYQSDGESGVVSSLGGSTIDDLTCTTAGPANFASGLDHDQIAGPLAVADTFTTPSGTTSDFVMQYVLDQLGTGNADVSFCYQDATHRWRVRISAGGNLQLQEVDVGSSTRLSAIGVLAGGEVITIVADGSDISMFYDNTLVGTYASAVNFRSETNGEVTTLNNALLSDLVTRHRYPEGNALSNLTALVEACD